MKRGQWWVAVMWLVSSACSGVYRVDAGAEDAGVDDAGADASVSIDAGVDAGADADAGVMCPWRNAPGDRPLFPWLEFVGDAGVFDGGSSCAYGEFNSLACTGRARIESADAGPVLVFDDGSQLAWADERSGGLPPPRVTGLVADVSLSRFVRRANPFGPLVETITMRVFEPASGRVLWFSRGGYAVTLAVSDPEAIELFGQTPIYRELCTTRFNHSVCWPVVRTFNEVELGLVVLQPNELQAVAGYQVRWTQSGGQYSRPPTCSGDDSAFPGPDCSFAGSYQGP